MMIDSILNSLILLQSEIKLNSKSNIRSQNYTYFLSNVLNRLIILNLLVIRMVCLQLRVNQCFREG